MRRNLVANPLCILVFLADLKSGFKLTIDKDLEGMIIPPVFKRVAQSKFSGGEKLKALIRL
jgi:hypothetical protein